VPFLMPGIADIYAFPIILLISLVGCFAGSLLTPPDDEAILKHFYLKVRPWGFWKPIHDKLIVEYPELVKNKDLGRDAVNVIVGMAWQTALTAAPVFLVIEQWRAFGISMLFIAVSSVFLKFNWWNKLEDYPDELAKL